jgi:hypothetical protein
LQSEEARIDITGVNNALLDTYGLRYFTVDNRYINSVGDAQTVGEDYFRDLQRSQDVYEVQHIYPTTTDFSIGDKVTFTDGLGTSITGLCVKQSIRFNASDNKCVAGEKL